MTSGRGCTARWVFGLVLMIAPALAAAQEGTLHAELRGEAGRVANACGAFQWGAIAGCAVALATDTPLHLSVGSLPPQNGLGVGEAFALGKATSNWRMNWDIDGVATLNGSWRTGVMMTMARAAQEPTMVISHNPDARTKKRLRPFTHATSVYRFYLQSSAIAALDFYGLGDDAPAANASVFGMRETIAGASAIKPVTEWSAAQTLDLSLFGSVNGRFVKIDAPTGQPFAPVTTTFTAATAPGLSHQPVFLQATQGLRIAPSVGALHLDYAVSIDEFEAASSAHNSFLRWTFDLNHTVGLYGKGPAVSQAPTFGPDQCADVGTACAAISRERNLSGSVGFELRVVESAAGSANTIPFYFQPTLGGSDINGTTSLGSYADYRFRAPNLLLLREHFEHSLWGPFGFEALADEGRVALTRSSLGFDHLRHSFAAGITLRAGGFPVVNMLFAWGGGEGTHTIFGVDSSLMGGAARPDYD